MKSTKLDLAQRLLGKGFNTLNNNEKKVIERIQKHLHISRNINKEFDDTLTFGQRIADKVASFGGSWTFIIIFAFILLSWVILNSVILLHKNEAFDPYPYILLNLFLSMLAAIQAPIIMMSQNRQAAKDRMDAAHDYEVNLKAELEISRLHDKIEELGEDKWSELISLQEQQIELLNRLLDTTNDH